MSVSGGDGAGDRKARTEPMFSSTTNLCIRKWSPKTPTVSQTEPTGTVSPSHWHLFSCHRCYLACT